MLLMKRTRTSGSRLLSTPSECLLTKSLMMTKRRKEAKFIEKKRIQ